MCTYVFHCCGVRRPIVVWHGVLMNLFTASISMCLGVVHQWCGVCVCLVPCQRPTTKPSCDRHTHTHTISTYIDAHKPGHTIAYVCLWSCISIPIMYLLVTIGNHVDAPIVSTVHMLWTCDVYWRCVLILAYVYWRCVLAYVHKCVCLCVSLCA
jgi:hypothetical protein